MDPMTPSEQRASAGDRSDSTIDLLQRLQGGDDGARQALLARYRPILLRWAHGRLPASARGMQETEDLVQLTLIRVLHRVDQLESTREGAFLAYLRKILVNLLRDELRKLPYRMRHATPDDPMLQAPVVGGPDGGGALDDLIERRSLEAYEEALEALPPLQREAVMLRLEFRYSYLEIAEAIGSPSANAARMMVVRSLARLARALQGAE